MVTNMGAYWYFHFKGLLFATRECIPNPGKLIRLWLHEANRVYSDKLVDHKDKDTLAKLLLENIKKHYPVSFTKKISR